MKKDNLRYQIKKKRKWESDRYDARYYIEDEEIKKTIWEEASEVGPGAFNLNHVEVIRRTDESPEKIIGFDFQNDFQNSENAKRKMEQKLSIRYIKFNP